MSRVLEPDSTEDEIVEGLSSSTLTGKWGDVVDIYQCHPWTNGAKINNYNDTVLHVAADCGEEDTVKQLLDAILKHSNKGE